MNRKKLGLSGLVAELAERDGRRGRIYSGLRRLLRVRRGHAAFAPSADQRALPTSGALFALIRGAGGPQDEILCLHNVSTTAQSFSCNSWPAASSADRVRDLISDRMIDWSPHDTTTLAPFQSLWLKMQ